MMILKVTSIYDVIVPTSTRIRIEKQNWGCLWACYTFVQKKQTKQQEN